MKATQYIRRILACVSRWSRFGFFRSHVQYKHEQFFTIRLPIPATMGGEALVPLVFLLLLQVCVAFKFDSAPGFALVRKILLGLLSTFEPHHYQMDGVARFSME